MFVYLTNGLSVSCSTNYLDYLTSPHLPSLHLSSPRSICWHCTVSDGVDGNVQVVSDAQLNIA